MAIVIACLIIGLTILAPPKVSIEYEIPPMVMSVPSTSISHYLEGIVEGGLLIQNRHWGLNSESYRLTYIVRITNARDKSVHFDAFLVKIDSGKEQVILTGELYPRESKTYMVLVPIGYKEIRFKWDKYTNGFKFTY